MFKIEIEKNVEFNLLIELEKYIWNRTFLQQLFKIKTNGLRENNSFSIMRHGHAKMNVYNHKGIKVALQLIIIRSL